MLHRNPVSMVRRLRLGLLSSLLLAWCSLAAGQATGPAPQPLPGTKPLTMTGDIASELVAGVDRFLLRQIERIDGQARAALEARLLARPRPTTPRSSPTASGWRTSWACAIARVPFDGLAARRHQSDRARPAGLGRRRYNVFAVRWPAFGDVTGEGLLLEPGDRLGVADVIVIPDADQTPEQLVGLVPGRAAPSRRSRGGWPRAAAA